MSTFVITGGHHNSALVVAKELVSRGHKVLWYGHRRAAAGDLHDSAEYLEVKAAGLPFFDLMAGKSTFSFTNFAKIPLGFIHATSLLSRHRPDAVLSFGGYLGLTTILPAYFMRIPIYLHEQTAIAGKANLLTAHLASRIYLTWPSSAAYYPKNKSLLVGLPLRPIFATQPLQKIKSARPTILILGGKQGSHVINRLIFDHLDSLLTDYSLIHQTGTSSVTGDYEQAVILRDSLPKKLAQYYDPRGYIGESEISICLTQADLVVGRSGAHITYELAVLGQKSVLIPLLSTHGREQLHNARLLESSRLATIVPQSELSYHNLKTAIDKMLRQKFGSPLDVPRDATNIMISDLLTDLYKH